MLFEDTLSFDQITIIIAEYFDIFIGHTNLLKQLLDQEIILI